MSIQVEAIYSNGMLKLDQPLPLKENERITISISQSTNLIEESYGRVKWNGTAEGFDYLAHSQENSVVEQK